jgi:hypothetical protein
MRLTWVSSELAFLAEVGRSRPSWQMHGTANSLAIVDLVDHAGRVTAFNTS